MVDTKPRRRRRRKAGSLASLRAVVWSAILAAEALLEDDNPETRLKAAHAISQLSGAYGRATESATLEARIAKLEAAVAKMPPLPDGRRALGRGD